MSVSRNISLDVLRIMACMLIVLMHSPMPSTESGGFVLSAISYFTAPGIGIFFMISGALLLPVKVPAADFLKKRVCKLIWPIVFWSLAYMLIGHLMSDTRVSAYEMLSILLTVKGNPTLWFLYTLTGLYLISPIISPWLEKASFKDATIYMCVFALAFFLPVLSIWLPTNSGDTGYLYYFCGYGGYYILGWYMTKWGSRIKLGWLAMGFTLSVALAVGCKVCRANVDFYSLFWYKSILVLVPALFWFKLFQSLSPNFEKWPTAVKKRLIGLSSLTFGIYLIHFAVVRDVLWRMPFVAGISNYALQCLIIASTAFIASWLFSWLISFLPFSHYLIGWKRK